MFDLIGWIFSVTTGKIDSTASKKNYYLPLLSVYCTFCRRPTERLKIPGVDPGDGEVHNDPAASHIIWFTNPEDDKTYVCLSAALDCSSQASQARYGTKKREIRRDRARQSQDIHLLPGDVNINVIPQGGTQLYGMCAETVPFLFIKS